MFKDNFIKQSKVNTVTITIVFRIANMVMIVINLSTKIKLHKAFEGGDHQELLQWLASSGRLEHKGTFGETQWQEIVEG